MQRGRPARREQATDGERVLLMRAGPCVVLAALAAWLCGCDPRVRPNVLLLVMDTTRADRCSFNGYPRPTTPRIAEFAEDAVVFRQAWSPANWTGPAHASLFTGLVPQRHGFHRGSRPYLLGGLPVLAEEFARSGYATACFTNNEVVSPELGLTRGFGTLDLRFRDEARPYPWAAATHEAAARWAQEQAAAGRPFFLFVNDVEPHQTYDPPAGDAARFLRDAPDDREIAEARAFRYPRNLAYDAGAETIDERGMALLSDLYDAEIAALDREVGVLLDRLRASGLLDSTVVVLVADHGEQFGEHGLVEHSVGLYAPVCHVPLVVRWPGRFDGGRVEDDVVRLEDVAPTLLELCRLPPLAGIDGRSLTRDLPGRVARAMQPAHDWWAAEAQKRYPGPGALRLARGAEAVFDGRRRLIAYSDGTVELFDPRSDPLESRDLAPSEPDEVKRLGALLLAPN